MHELSCREYAHDIKRTSRAGASSDFPPQASMRNAPYLGMDL